MMLYRIVLTLALCISATALSQERDATGRARNPGLSGWCETPVAQRKAEAGCYTTAITELGVLPSPPLYWHLDTFPSEAAARTARDQRSTVVAGHGKYWLFTIATASWRPSSGERIAIVGPLVVQPEVAYTAHYLETVIGRDFQDGSNNGHRHPGPEAWYLVAGGQCLETPNGVMIATAGQTMLAPEGWPMSIASIGNDTRRAVALVLHRSDQPYSMPIDAHADMPHAQWKPKGLCGKL